MKRAKLLRLIEQVRAETRLENDRTVTFDNLTVDFEAGTVRFRGRTIKPFPQKTVTFPMLSTDHLVIPKDGGEVI